MKHLAVLLLVVGIAGGAIYYNHRRKTEVQAGPQAISNWAADLSRQTSRVPMHVTRLSDAEEVRIGATMAADLQTRHSRHSYSQADLAFENYLNAVGTPLALRAKRRLEYKFYFIPDERFFNAYALPGGHIVIGKGLARALDSEDQLAAVLAHEIEHVDRYHCMERIQLEARARNIPFARLMTLPVAIFQSGYSKEQEMEADREAAFLMQRSGYTAQGAVRLFEIFERLQSRRARQAANPLEETAGVAAGAVFDYFRSHPLPAERKRQMQDLIVHENWPAKLEKPLRVAV